MAKTMKNATLELSEMPTTLYDPTLSKRNRALLYALGGFSILLYCISFVRMGQW